MSEAMPGRFVRQREQSPEPGWFSEGGAYWQRGGDLDYTCNLPEPLFDRLQGGRLVQNTPSGTVREYWTDEDAIADWRQANGN